MAIGIFGGSFDPIHFGHLLPTLFIKENRKLEKVFFIPNYISPLKQNSNSVEDFHRLKMVELAIKNINGFDLSDFELKRKSISYTIDTINEFKKFYNDIELIIGYDNYIDFEKWNKPDEIINKSKVIVMKRHLDNFDNQHNSFKDKMIFVKTPTIEISSTEIRNRIKNNLNIDYYLPHNVIKYIYENGLYK